jgi:hypothetical protein
MLILLLFLFLGSVIAFAIFFKESKHMKLCHEHEVFYLERRIVEENDKFKKSFQNNNSEKQIQSKLSILKKQAALLTFISNHNDQ